MKRLFYIAYHKFLLVIGRTPVKNTQWYKKTIYEEAQWIIGNRPWRKPF